MEKISFVWDIHYTCNFRCPFCWFNDKWEEMGKLNRYFSVGEMVKIWEKMRNKYRECHIMITGGEPSLYPNFIELIDELSKLHTIKITSQLSGDYYTFAKKIDPKRVCLDMNFHPLESKLEPFIKKVKTLKNHGFSGGVCYLAYPPQMNEISFYQKEFEKNGINFALAAFWGEYGGKRYPESYSEEERKIITPFLGDIARIKYHLEGRQTKGKLCRSGHVHASIKANGNVTRCGPLSDKPIGNIFDNNFELFDEPKPCEAEICPCDEYIWLVDAN
ncbi:MAG: radical SAM protein [Elusimicrobia bacterium]|nr:radical SAM protein [Candidatus Liberimonas magnetica]